VFYSDQKEHSLTAGSGTILPATPRSWMTENLEPAFSKLQMFDAKRLEVDQKDTKVNRATMTVSLPKLVKKI
jgi:hypothetical protein